MLSWLPQSWRVSCLYVCSIPYIYNHSWVEDRARMSIYWTLLNVSLGQDSLCKDVHVLRLRQYNWWQRDQCSSCINYWSYVPQQNYRYTVLAVSLTHGTLRDELWSNMSEPSTMLNVKEFASSSSSYFRKSDSSVATVHQINWFSSVVMWNNSVTGISVWAEECALRATICCCWPIQKQISLQFNVNNIVLLTVMHQC